MPQVSIKYTQEVTETWIANVDVPQDVIDKGKEAITIYCNDAESEGLLEDQILTDSNVNEINECTIN